MSLQPANFQEAKAAFKPMKRTEMKRRTKSSAIPYGTNSVSRKKGGRKKLRSMKTLKKLVWKHFSIFIRTSNADGDGYVQCVTCPAIYLWNSGDIHAGHWIHDRLDYDERNIHPQCFRCNYRWNTTVNVSYSIYMARTYGVEVMDELRLLSHTHGNRYTRIELDDLLAHYKEVNAQNPLTKTR